ncbi:MAG: hypothetical protein RR248_05555 [Clostridia bacterium]
MFVDILLKHYNKYPLMRIDDFVKLIYQSEFGAHFNPNYDVILQGIEEECRNLTPQIKPTMPISSNLVRVDLQDCLYKGVKFSILANMFCLSSLEGNQESICQKFDILLDLIQSKKINLSLNATKAFLINYKKSPYALSHSMAYSKNYQPHYRVIDSKLWQLYKVIEIIEGIADKKGTVVVAFEGCSASGKTTTAGIIKNYFGSRCNLFHTDNFFLPQSLKTKERLAEIGGNINYEKLQELLHSIRQGQVVGYQSFDCHTQTFTNISLPPSNINIVEGVYSLHPTLIKNYDQIFLFSVDKYVQQQRITLRDGQEGLKQYNEVWLPLENKYLNSLALQGEVNYIDANDLDNIIIK